MRESSVSERRYLFRKNADYIKEAVPLIAYAGGLTDLQKRGGTLVGRCPLPDHADNTPSFTVWPGNNSWWCFGCGRGTDLVDLYYHLHDCSEMWEAVLGLSLELGIELPCRSEAWHRATRRKAEYRDVAYQVLGNVLKRRLFKTLVLPYINLIVDSEEHERELDRSWREWADWWRWPSLAEDLIAGNMDALGAISAAKVAADRLAQETTSAESGGLDEPSEA